MRTDARSATEINSSELGQRQRGEEESSYEGDEHTQTD